MTSVHGTRTVADFVLRAAERTPDRAAIIDGSRRSNWADLAAALRGRAAGLLRLGLVPGDRMVLQVGTSLDFVEVYLGALHAGVIVVPVNPAYTARELHQVLSDSGARALVTSAVPAIAAAIDLQAELAELEFVISAIPGRTAMADADDAPAGTRLLSVLTDRADATRPEPDSAEPDRAEPDRAEPDRAEPDRAEADGAEPDRAEPDRAEADGAEAEAEAAADETGPASEEIGVILYTSGTSGVPKGAMLSHRALLANVDNILAVRPSLVTADDVVFLPVPLSHIFGLNAGLAPALAQGATVVLSERFDPEWSLKVIAHEQVSIVVGAPGMFEAWSLEPRVSDGPGWNGVRLALSGSAPLPSHLVQRFAQTFGVPLHEGYGMTEAAPVVALNLVGSDGASRLGHPKAGSVGRPPPGVEVQLRDVEGDPIDDDDPGRLAVRGANLFSGYWPDGAGGPDPDGWFVTGDLAYRDDDGDLVLVGRDSELVLVNGFNVYPAEVESVLNALDGVSAAAVVGVPDAASGESLRAYVVAEPGQVLVPDELLAEAARGLARFKLPRRIDLVDELPYTLTGKVKKWQLP